MTREYTALPHNKAYVGLLWNQKKQNGNYDNWGRLPIDTIILHSMDGYVNGTISWFKTHNRSAHYGVGMDGGITNFIPENCVAYHAGKYAVNQRSIGIEFEDYANNQINRTDALYESGAKLLSEICKFYNIPLDRDHIKIHREIVQTACPGSLNVERILNGAIQLNNPTAMHTYQMPEEVFKNMVTKGTNLDNLLRSLDFPVELGSKADSYKEILAYIQSFIMQKVNDSIVSGAASEVAAGDTVENKPLTQLNQEQKKGVLNILSGILSFLKKKI